MPCTTCSISVEYTCGGSDSNAIQFNLRLVNNVGTSVPYSNITVRYWFTKNNTTPKMECYYATLSCTNVTGTFVPVSPAFPTADTYLEVGFTAGAGTLEGFHNVPTEQIKLAVHDTSYQSPTIQTDDYSFNCATMTEFQSPLITAYVGGALVFGTEPGGSSTTGTGGTGGTTTDASAGN